MVKQNQQEEINIKEEKGNIFKEENKLNNNEGIQKKLTSDKKHLEKRQ